MLKKIGIVVAEVVILLSLGTLLFIGITGGSAFSLGFVLVKVRHVKNPLIFLTIALVLRRVLHGTFFREFISIAYIIRKMRLIAVIAILRRNRRILLDSFNTSSPGKAWKKGIAWIFEEDEKKPAFSFFPEKYASMPKWLFAVLIVSLLLNIYGIWWGLPGERGWAPDELIPKYVLEGIEQRFSHGWSGKLYPPLHYYILAVSYIPGFILQQYDLFDAQSFSGYTAFFYMGRSVSVLMGVAIVYMVYLCGLELYHKKAALFTAGITALIAPFLYYAKIANLDVPYTFWFVLSLFFYIRILKYHRTADYLLFSVFMVASICTKDQASGLYVLTWIAIVFSHYRYHKKRNPSARIMFSVINRKTLLSLLVAIMTFFLIYNVFFNMEGFMMHIKLTSGYVSVKEYENTLAGHAELLWQTLKHIRFSFGWPVFLVCVFGLGTALFQVRRNALLLWILVPGISYYLFFVSIIRFSRVRYMLTVYIILAFFGGKCFSDFLTVFQRFYKGRIALVSLILGYTFCYAAGVDVLMDNDSKYYVETWMKEHIPGDSLVELIGLIEDMPRAEDLPRKVYLFFPSIRELEIVKPDYVVINASVRFGSQEFYSQLEAEKLNYTLALQYKSNPVWGRLIQRHIMKDDGKDIYTNLNKVDPEIKVFKRKS